MRLLLSSAALQLPPLLLLLLASHTGLQLEAAPQAQQPADPASWSLVPVARAIDGASPAGQNQSSPWKEANVSSSPAPTTPTTTTTSTMATGTANASTPSPFLLSTEMPRLDANLDLLDYPKSLLTELHFANMAANNADNKTSQLLARHHNNDELHDYLKQLAADYPAVTRLYSIGESVEGRKLWVLAIGESPGEHVRLKPEFRYIANMHGNEVVGRELLLHLARLILDNYYAPESVGPTTAAGNGSSGGGGAADSETPLEPSGAKFIKKLVRATRIHLMPSMNPDGHARAAVACMFEEPSRRGRLNANNIDLNRDFPDEALEGRRQERGCQPEVRAVMEWSRREPFVLSANLHGGALVANYPYDGSTNSSLLRDPTRRSPDHELFKTLALAYSHYHPTMYTGAMCYDKCTDYHNETFEAEKGTTTGAAWYALHGGMQDWMYNNTNDFHTTIELGCNQYPPALALPQYWDMNKEPLLNYLRQVHRGIKGTVRDGATGAYLANVTVHVEGLEHNVTSSQWGDYFRLLLAGEYVVRFEHARYHTERLHVRAASGMAQIYHIKLEARDRPASSSSVGEQVANWISGAGGPQQQLPNSGGVGGPSDGAGDANSDQGPASRDDDHALVVATLVMSVLTILLLLSMVAAYLIQKQRYHRSQSVSVELQPTARSSSTGVALAAKQAGAAGHNRQQQQQQPHRLSASGSTINTNISA